MLCSSDEHLDKICESDSAIQNASCATQIGSYCHILEVFDGFYLFITVLGTFLQPPNAEESE